MMKTRVVPAISEVNLLPNLFIAINYQNGITKYVRSTFNQNEVTSLRQGIHNGFGATQLTPGYYWIGSEIKINEDNTFTVNGEQYDGNHLYREGLNHY